MGALYDRQLRAGLAELTIDGRTHHAYIDSSLNPRYRRHVEVALEDVGVLPVRERDDADIVLCGYAESPEEAENMSVPGKVTVVLRRDSGVVVRDRRESSEPLEV